MKTKALLRRLSKMFPKRLGEWYDHLGLQVGKLPEDVNKIMVCLDFDDEIYDIAVKENVDLIITHHPFIFGKLKKVLERDPVKKALYEKMAEKNIPIVSYHTNFDAGEGGMNCALTEALGLENIKRLKTFPMAMGGTLKEEMEVHEFAKYAKERLGVSYGLLINEGKPTVKSVAIIGGGGWQEYLNAMQEGYDIYISGDCPHHGRREIVLNHYNYLDLPHEIERIFIPTMTKILLSFDKSLDIVQVDHERLPEVI